MITGEKLLPLQEAVRLVFEMRPAPSTVTRWAQNGTLGADGRRHKLEAVKMGGRWYTSRAAVKRYAEALSAPSPASR